MQTICLFASDYASSREVHLALKRLLDLPDYYGLNADALNDCLSELPGTPALWFRPDAEGEAASADEAPADSRVPPKTIGDVFASMMSRPGAASAMSTRMAMPRTPSPTVGRNDPCPCGSGKKYKKCCGRNIV